MTSSESRTPTADHLAILRFLFIHGLPHTAYEIGTALKKRNPGDWTHGKLRLMERAGLVKKLGVSAFGPPGRCWGITEAGNEAYIKVRASISSGMVGEGV